MQTYIIRWGDMGVGAIDAESAIEALDAATAKLERKKQACVPHTAGPADDYYLTKIARGIIARI